MRIGELSKKTGLATSKIRFYEEVGLLERVSRSANGYRTYPDDTVIVLNLIVNAQKAGFSLDEIRLLLPKSLDHWQHDSLIMAIKQKMSDIEVMEHKLAQSKQQLKRVLAQIEAKPNDMDCADNAKRVIEEMVGGQGGSVIGDT
ncbi:MerR family transcriptional regulator [Pseudoalteromonas sp. MMG022]|uniref:MerR family transcriptional regulator n=1 Tax=Pseudoalteromonas sp. MMG022 TaxID=2909978 RepID=UPI001F0171D7|nr:MerR family transcriptional regulator [Pseudoalteromonas sp. MMG022]MCF6433984.1 MerR family transcriptional regulator [Pseudoalteromonas sp. MMG022]